MHVIEIDFCDPAAAADALRGLPFLTFLDSAVTDERLGRYSFVTVDPFARFEFEKADPDWIARLNALLGDYHTATLPGLPPFQGGAAGLFSYDLGRSLERLPEPTFDPLAYPGLSLGLYDVTVAFDLAARRAFVISTGFPETEPRLRERRAVERARLFEELLRRGGDSLPQAGLISLEGWTSNFTRGGYQRGVRVG